MARQPLLECGSELGSVVLWGHRGRDEPWQFQTVATDWAVCLREWQAGMLPTRAASSWVSSWREALALLDARPWERLIPGTIHEEFAEAVLQAVLRRLAGRQDERARGLRERWTLACRPRRLAAVY